jgi:hypothetical protein
VALRRKIERLARIERLRRRMHELAQWRLAIVAQEREMLATAHAEMIVALGEGLMAYGPQAAAGARRVRGLETEMTRVGAVEKDLEKQTLDDGRLAKLADRYLEGARDAWREKSDRRTLEELIESTIASASGPRKP